MTEHQIHILTKFLMALPVMLGMIVFFSFVGRRYAKRGSVKTEKIELLNFDEARRRKNNLNKKNQRGKRKKMGGGGDG